MIPKLPITELEQFQLCLLEMMVKTWLSPKRMIQCTRSTSTMCGCWADNMVLQSVQLTLHLFILEITLTHTHIHMPFSSCSLACQADQGVRKQVISYLPDGCFGELEVSLGNRIVTLQPCSVCHFEVETGELTTKELLEG